MQPRVKVEADGALWYSPRWLLTALFVGFGTGFILGVVTTLVASVVT